MTTASAPAATQNVHIEIPHFHAMYEGAVAWDACGPVANEVAVAALEGRTPDTGNAMKARARDLAAGRFTAHSGQTLADIVWDLQQRGYTDLQVIGYSGAPDSAYLNALHTLIKAGASAQHPVIIEVSRAYNLPDNEAGVQYHFVVIGGIDSVAGYLVANGDTRTGIAQHPGWPAIIPLNWAGWGTLEAAGICGAILVKPKPGQQTDALVIPIIPTRWTDNGKTLHAPNDGTCGHGFRWAVMTWASRGAGDWDATLEPVTGEESDPAGVHQDFRHNGDANAAGLRLIWHESDGSVTSSPLDAITPPPPPAPTPALPTPPVTPDPLPGIEKDVADLNVQMAQLMSATQAAATQAAQALSAAQAAQSDVTTLRNELKAV